MRRMLPPFIEATGRPAQHNRVMQGSDTQIATNRFGLGWRMGDKPPCDAKRWLMDQIDAYSPAVATPPTLRSSAELASLFTKGHKDNIGGRTRTASGGTAKGARREARAAYVMQAAGRVKSGIASDTPFIDRLVYFWANHFAVSVGKVEIRGFGGLLEFEAIRPHVLGNFSDMLLAVERHPAMLVYLDQVQSVGPTSEVGKRTHLGINENLGREILELHTLGVDGGYSQADVRELSLAMTGWTVGGWGSAAAAKQTLSGPAGRFAFSFGLHEPGLRKLMDRAYEDAGEAQAEAILQELAIAPSTGRHLATKLARHFVSDDPPTSLVNRLELAFRRSKGDLRTLYRALIDSPECWRPPPSKFRSPWLWGLAVLRAIGFCCGSSGALSDDRLVKLFRDLGQPIWNPGTPAGFEDDAGSWASPAALMRRVELVSHLITAQTTLEPRWLGEQLFGGGLSERTLALIAKSDRHLGLALLLLSPEMMRV